MFEKDYRTNRIDNYGAMLKHKDIISKRNSE